MKSDYVLLSFLLVQPQNKQMEMLTTVCHTDFNSGFYSITHILK
jgi:hypothetical protein